MRFQYLLTSLAFSVFFVGACGSDSDDADTSSGGTSGSAGSGGAAASGGSSSTGGTSSGGSGGTSAGGSATGGTSTGGSATGGTAGSGTGGTSGGSGGEGGDTFACGPLSCQRGEEFCHRHLPGMPDEPEERECQPFPEDCAASDCSCFCSPGDEAPCMTEDFCTCTDQNEQVELVCAVP